MTMTASIARRGRQSATSSHVAKTQSPKNLLQWLFNQKPDNQIILAWFKDKRCTHSGKCKCKKVSSYFTDVNKAVEYALTQKDEFDVYFGLGTSSIKKSYKQRFTKDEIQGLCCLFVDIDFGDTHQKPNLPPTQQDAISLLMRMPVAPTFIIDSGYGLHAYWLLKEFFKITSDDERNKIEKLNHDWQLKLKELANEHEWTIDATHDLSRVLRVPETFNHKHGASVPVKQLVNSEKTYTLEELGSYISNGEAISPTSKSYEKSLALAGDLVLSENPVVDADKRDLLFELFPKAQITYEYKRKDFADQSPSSYDMSLTNFAVQAGWSNQEICNLLISFRRKHGKDLKLREDYYARTISRARHDLAKSEQETLRQEAIETPISDDKTENLTLISTALGINIAKIEKFNLPEPTYTIYLSDRTRIDFKSVNELRSQRVFGNRVYAAINREPYTVKKSDWKQLLDKIGASFEIVEPPEGISDESALRDQLANYLREYYAQSDDEETQVNRLKNNNPAKFNNKVVFNLEDFRLFLKRRYKEEPTRPRISQMLRNIKSEPKKEKVTYKAVTIERRCWTVPDEVLQLYRETGGYEPSRI